MMLFGPGHRACAGCGCAVTIRHVLEALEGKCFVVNSTGCMEVVSTPYPESSWEVPYIHSLFENASAVAAGIETALKSLSREHEGKVVVIAGDGATADIGVQTLSGMMFRGHDILYVCYDNEAYMNTGVQMSGLTPLGAHTTTSPAGKSIPGNLGPKKDMPAIALAHGAKYVATASMAFLADIKKKIRKARDITGPSYIQIHSTCVPGWGIDSARSVEIARLAVETGLYPIFEYENGQLVSVRKIKNRKPVEEYLKVQARFRHLFKDERGKEIIEKIQEIADYNAQYYGLDA
jgi:pyruvate ferredoxin oxidoreductase beta subunit